MTSGAGAGYNAAVVHRGGFPASSLMATITRCSRTDMVRRFTSGFGTIVTSRAGASRDAAVVHGGWSPTGGFVATITA
ncbi:MAG: hypothetical protein Q7T79_01530 [bacterium]|nr:hypothetical protein [bacterium]